VRADRAALAVLGVAGREVRAAHPGVEVLLRAPLRDDEADLAVVARAQEREGLEALGGGDLAGAGREPALELAEPVARDGDGVDLDDAHAAGSCHAAPAQLSVV